MPTSKSEYKKKLESARRTQERALARQKARQADPAWRQNQIEKRRAQQRRAAVRQRERMNSPEHRQKLINTANRLKEMQIQKRREKAAVVKVKDLPRKKIKSRGTKGRSRTAEEKRLEALIGNLGCICCLNKGWYTCDMQEREGQRFISMHHVDGRTKPWAHAKQLPLCMYHHDTPAPPYAPAELFPIHRSSKKCWGKVNGTEEELLVQVYEMINEKMPWVDEA